MKKLYNQFPEYSFSQEERIFTSVGLVLVSITVLIIIIEEGIAPFFTRFNWVLVSFVWHLIIAASGIFLLWQGLGQAISHKWNHHWLFKITQWLIVKMVRAIPVILSLLAELMFGDDSTSNKRNIKGPNSDDIWDNHPKHYYDKKPPDSFS